MNKNNIKIGPKKRALLKLVQKKQVVTPIPKIIWTDVRNLFSKMFTNVFNTMDFSLSDSFFHQYCSNDMTLLYTMSPELNTRMLKHDPNCARDIIITNPTIAATYIQSRSLLYPDIRMALLGECEVIHDENSEECQIVMQICNEGSRVRDSGGLWLNVVQGPLSNDIHTSNSSTFNVEAVSQAGERGVMIGYSIAETEAIVDSLPLLAQPLIVKGYGTVTLNVNKDKKITKIELLFSRIDLSLK
jgi:hypothetical protein